MFKYAFFALTVLSSANAFSYDYFQNSRETMRQLNEDFDRAAENMYQRDLINAIRGESDFIRRASKAPTQYNTFKR